MTDPLDIPLLQYDELDSTSSECQRLLKVGERRPPFAVWARQQLEGRGRRGHVWRSPAGNLYLSMAFSTQQSSTDEVGLWPLKVANLLCWWLATKFDLRVTLKWPNDLYFGGAKLGGVLCESAVRGGQWSDVVIGMGLNVNVSPDVEEIRTTSLKQVLGVCEDVERLAYSVTKFFERHWANYQSDDVAADYQHFGIEVGQLWREQHGFNDLHRLQGIGSDGALKLQSLTNPGHVRSLHASTEQLRWIYASHQLDESPVIVADVGNSSTKISYFTAPTDDLPAKVFRCSVDRDAKEWVPELKELLDARGVSPSIPWPIHYLSVNSEHLDRIRAQTESSFSWVEIPRRPIRYRGPYAMSEIGMDRFANLEALMQQHTGKPILVISLGTATTVDLVSDHGSHGGGWILAGLTMSLQALGGGGADLPTLELGDHCFKSCTTLLGTNSKSALLDGCLQSVVQMVRGLRETAALELKVDAKDVAVVVTGGHAWRFADCDDWAINPHLTAQGAKLMVLGGKGF